MAKKNRIKRFYSVEPSFTILIFIRLQKLTQQFYQSTHKSFKK